MGLFTVKYRFVSMKHNKTCNVDSVGGSVMGRQLRTLILQSSGMNRLSTTGRPRHDRLELYDSMDGRKIMDDDCIPVHSLNLILAKRLPPVDSRVLQGATPLGHYDGHLFKLSHRC